MHSICNNFALPSMRAEGRGRMHVHGNYMPGAWADLMVITLGATVVM